MNEQTCGEQEREKTDYVGGFTVQSFQVRIKSREAATLSTTM
jgi:hypothetical protein